MRRSVLTTVSLLATVLAASASFAAQAAPACEAQTEAQATPADDDQPSWVRSKSVFKHETFITNDWFDNWYIGAAGGVLTSFSKVSNPRLAPEFDLNILKWFTPEIGVRIGYAGQWGKEYLTNNYNPYSINHSPLPFDGTYGGPGTLSYNMFYAYGNLLWNVTNTFGGYSNTRAVNVSPYVNFGILRMYDPDNSACHDNEIAFGAGLYSTYRLTERWVVSLDIRHVNTASRYKTLDGVRTNFLSASIGMGYNIFRTYWNRTSTVLNEAAEAKAEAEAALVELKEKEAQVEAVTETVKAREQQVQKLEKEIVEVKKEAEGRVEPSVKIVYFDLNSSVLPATEKLHLADIMAACSAGSAAPKFVITGSADEDTGTPALNEKLSAARADCVKNILIKEYGVDPANIETRNTSTSDTGDRGPFYRCVTIECK